uniref:hypothetical protein n=1 Tax=Thaumasiovibrio occultus TaxID=1891184 RepID=UPI000B360E68|nr:hypothetical protein [Thaumasiovibrio occultus]
MKTLAQLSFEYLWLILFEGEDVIDPDYSVRIQETLPEYFASMTEDEKSALSAAAKEAQNNLLSEPDGHGYTPHSLVTEEQKVFMEALSTGELFEQWA